MERHAVNPRPYWHVDVKWIFGLALFWCVASLLLVYNLVAATERNFAVTSSATIIANMFSKNGLDDDSGLEDLRQKVATQKSDTVVIVASLPSVTLTKHDVLTLSARELKIKYFSQLTGQIYDKGLADAARSFTPNVSDQATFERQAAVLGAFTQKTHQQLFVAFLVLCGAAVLFAAGLIFFSFGWGRLVSPGIVLLLTGLPGALVGLLLRYPPQDGHSAAKMLPGDIATGLGDHALQSYGVAALCGGVLLVAAFVGVMIRKIRSKPMP